jgi:membrane-bound serine protease (ClpP class)
MTAEKGFAIDDFRDGKGKVRIHGEIWNAISNNSIRKGDEITVKKVDGLTLIIG